jgi:hypothetical protein
MKSHPSVTRTDATRAVKSFIGRVNKMQPSACATPMSASETTRRRLSGTYLDECSSDASPAARRASLAAMRAMFRGMVVTFRAFVCKYKF